MFCMYFARPTADRTPARKASAKAARYSRGDCLSGRDNLFSLDDVEKIALRDKAARPT
jgi:hypothetical protein